MARPSRNRGEWRPAARLPVARVAVDVALAHLDRPFDYRVPEHLDAVAVPGVRLRVRFAGRLVDGFLLERLAESAHGGTLAWVEKVVSAEPVLTPEVAALCRTVADRYAGVLADVLRLAVPPRHARVEGEVPAVRASRAAEQADGSGREIVHHPGEPADRPVTGDARPADGGPTGRVGDAPEESADERTVDPGAPHATESGGGPVVGSGDRRAVEPGDRREAGHSRPRGEEPADSPGGGPVPGAADLPVAVLAGPGGVAPALAAAGSSRVDQVVGGTAVDQPDGVPAAWQRYQRGPALIQALAAGRAAHAVWQALPGESWPERFAEAAAACVTAGRGAVLVVPDQRDVAALHTACAARLGADAVVALTAELGPAERYRRWLAVRRGQVRVVVGTRSAAFAPVERLGLLAVWDDGDDLHAEPRAPYPHVRDVLVLRAHSAGAALVVGGFARTAEAHLLVESGWAREVVADRATVRAAMPRITALGETEGQLARDPDSRAARLPHLAFEAARSALGSGMPVLVQVPRSGYLPWLACGACRETARCRHCAGPLGLTHHGGRPTPDDHAPPGGAGRPTRADASSAGLPHCRWCGRADSAFRCPACGSRRLRAGVVGSGRTAEELGRAFPGITVRSSGGGAPVLGEVGAGPGLVVATPGAEPRAQGGYGAALLLDGWALLSRPDLRVAEETLRRWLAAAALVVPHTRGGRVVVMADAAIPVVQALVRWDPAGHAAAEYASRAEVGFPPAVRMAAVEGTAAAVADVLSELPESVEVLGPVEIDQVGPGPGGGEPRETRERALLRVPRADGRALAAALHSAQAARTARKVPDPVRVRLDPVEIG